MMSLSVFLLVSAAASADEFSAYRNYIYDQNDFVTDIIAYNPGTGIVRDWLSNQLFDNPSRALGRPTIDTTGEDWYIPEDQPCPINPVYSAFRAYELVCLGELGSIILKFNHPVRNDENNPYGTDFIVFGNSQQTIGYNQCWTNGDPALTTVGAGGMYEPGIVSVSQDGITWYSFTTDANFMSSDSNFIKLPTDANDGPFCDSFAPTIGRVYDPNNPDSNIGSWNLWWAEPTNPTLPVDSSLTFASFDGHTVAQICQTYGNSAGGTGYDIDRLDIPIDENTGIKWFQYVRIDDKSGGGTTEIDAVSAVRGCDDCRIDFKDFAELANLWGKGLADIEDLKILVDNWLGWSWDYQ
jgi:hypothetical protein